MKRAAALVIGNEILSGKVQDTNSHFLARELRALGVDLRRILVVPDEVEEIARGVRELSPAHDLVFTSGGIGPTHDDVTLEGVARAFGRGLVREPHLADAIARHHDVARHPEALRMADLPEGAELLYAERIWVPVVVVENVHVLAGVPAIFERKLLGIRERFRARPMALRVLEVRAEEVEIAGLLYGIVARFPGVRIGSYPQPGPAPRVRLTLEGEDERAVEEATAELRAGLPPGAEG